jgi:hypothetical protein
MSVTTSPTFFFNQSYNFLQIFKADIKLQTIETAVKFTTNKKPDRLQFANEEEKKKKGEKKS